MKKVVIVDLPGSNSQGIKSAFLRLDQNSEISDDSRILRKAERLVIPGVGRFGAASEFLADKKLNSEIKKIQRAGIPILGICLGFQLLFQSSEESNGFRGLALLPGSATKLVPNEPQDKIPNIGWRRIASSGADFGESLVKDSLFYFAHSYELKLTFPETEMATARYGNHEFLAALKKENIWGSQFHPEKSHEAGLRFLEGFLGAHS